MLKQSLRLRKDFQFRYIYRNGTSVRTDAINLIFVKSRHTNIKIGVSVSNKIGKAVFRNRIKRWIREGVRSEIESLPKGYNYIFVANSKFDFHHSNYSMISNYIQKAIEQCALNIGTQTRTVRKK